MYCEIDSECIYCGAKSVCVCDECYVNVVYELESERIGRVQAYKDLPERIKDLVRVPRGLKTIVAKSKNQGKRVRKMPSKKKAYRNRVKKATEKNAMYVPCIEKRSYEKWHVDHIVPIEFGYKHNVPASLISCPENLQIVSKRYNFNKNTMLSPKARTLLFQWGYVNEPFLDEWVWQVA